MPDENGRPIKITVIEDPDDAEEARRRFQERMDLEFQNQQEQYGAEMKMLSKGGADQDGNAAWKSIMRRAGRR